MKKLEEYVRSIPDFPEPGIIFRDVTSVLQDADGLHLAIDGIMEKIGDGDDVDVIVGTAVKMIEELGGKVVKIVFLMELAGLKGRERLKDYDVESVICYEGK